MLKQQGVLKRRHSKFKFKENDQMRALQVTANKYIIYLLQLQERHINCLDQTSFIDSNYNQMLSDVTTEF
ncbi:unnamed protein product [Paramecium octaurelia]|uniref:Uncharacterized protein n=1 Tax=Paramecium octaurelia TaxID=43137 RepID=A0A8S1TBN6_PAROT|nr:unnamed protein product [Paramecium octaurelia]